MASIAMMLGGGLFNALAFSGTNYLFHYLEKNGEMKRHNMAMEKLQRDRDEYMKQRQRRIDFINNRLREEKHSMEDFKELNAAMQEYSRFHEQEELPPLMKKPVLSDYYKPRDTTTRNIEIGVLVLGSMVLTTVAYHALWKKYKGDD